MNKKLDGGITGKGFKPGKSGNPTGRPKSKKIIETLKAIANEPHNEYETKLDVICRQIIDKAVKGDLSFAKLLFERIEGKPFLNHNLSIERNDEPITVFRFESDDEYNERKQLPSSDKEND